jgi:hypothetical protein
VQNYGNLPKILVSILFMKHCYICLPFFLLFTYSTTFAQAAASPKPVTHGPSRADSIHAVHRMFSKHRVGGYVWASIGAAFTAQIIGASASGGSGNGSGAAVGIVVLGGIPAGIGISKLVRFSAGRESTILHAYDEGKALPHYVLRRLKKAKYFMP